MDLNNTGKRKRIYTKHKITTSENDNILLPEKGTQNKMRRYSDSDSPYLPPKYTSKNSTLQSPKVPPILLSFKLKFSFGPVANFNSTQVAHNKLTKRT